MADGEAEAPDSAAFVAALAARGTAQRTPCGDGEMVWRSWGDGPPLLFVHGGHGSWTHWIRNIESLSRRFRVIAPDMPGYGDSAMPPVPYSADSIAAIVAEGITRLLPARERFGLVGFSFGGVIGGRVARFHGTRANALVLVGTGGLGLPRGTLAPMRNWRRLSDPADRRAAHRRNLEILMIANPAKIDPLAVHLQTENAARTRVRSRPISLTHSLARLLPEIAAPLAAIWGERDATAGPYLEARRKLIEERRPGARTGVIEDAGHWVQYEAPERFEAALTETLDHLA